jgi:hypothetical protein
MFTKVNLQYSFESRDLVIRLVSSQKDAPWIIFSNIKHLSVIQVWKGEEFELCGYVIHLESGLKKGFYTLDSLQLPEEVHQELRGFFVLFCGISNYSALEFVVE